MFQARYKIPVGYMIVTVYSVDFNHDAFLIADGDKFKWVPMSEFAPVF
jgi:hypothetical protein